MTIVAQATGSTRTLGARLHETHAAGSVMVVALAPTVGTIARNAATHKKTRIRIDRTADGEIGVHPINTRRTFIYEH